MQPNEKPRRTRASYAPVASGLTPDARIKLPQIIGDPKANPPLPGIFPASRTQLYRLIQQGRFPAPLKPFPGCRASYWRYGDVLAAIRRMEDEGQRANYATPLERKRRRAGRVEAQ
ncbi:MAG: hypothetical protein M0Z99_35165 [Betaproteobacteria bacterium]|nr:hypothetical protein [Betaproteobacteria bacterium]